MGMAFRSYRGHNWCSCEECYPEGYSSRLFDPPTPEKREPPRPVDPAAVEFMRKILEEQHEQIMELLKKFDSLKKGGL